MGSQKQMKLKYLCENNITPCFFEWVKKFEMHRNNSVNLSRVTSTFELNLEIIHQNNFFSVILKMLIILTNICIMNNEVLRAVC